ncbi:MAG: hypothetical protein ACKVPJ_11485 [Chitinophagales bacterium]
MKPTMYLLTIITFYVSITTACNKENESDQDDPVQPETKIEWTATSNDVVIENFTSTSVTGGITPISFSITGHDLADVDPITTINIMEQPNPEVKEFTLNSTENLLTYTNFSFDALDSYTSIDGELNVTSYEEYFSAYGITQYLMDGTFTATCQDDDSPPNFVEITGSFTDVVFSDN